MRRRGCDSRRALQSELYGGRVSGAVESPKLDGSGQHRHAVPFGGTCAVAARLPRKKSAMGATPFASTNFRVMIRLADCNPVVVKPCRKTTSGALPPSPTNSTRKRNSRLACLSSRRQRGQHPSGSPFRGHEEDSNPPGLGPGDTRGRTEVPDHFLPVAQPQSGALLRRGLQVRVLPWRLSQFHRGITGVRRSVKARGRGANPRDGANGVQVDISWRHSSRKRDLVATRGGSITRGLRHFFKTNQRKKTTHDHHAAGDRRTHSDSPMANRSIRRPRAGKPTTSFARSSSPKQSPAKGAGFVFRENAPPLLDRIARPPTPCERCGPSFCSSIAEPSTDNRQTTERYRAEGPISARKLSSGERLSEAQEGTVRLRHEPPVALEV